MASQVRSETLVALKLFLFLVAAGGAGGLFGSIAGASFGKRGIFSGGVLGGLIVSWLAAALAGRFGWIEKSGVASVAIGAAAGFLAATAIAVNTLTTPWGPILSTLLIGTGGLAGRRRHARRGRS